MVRTLSTMLRWARLHLSLNFATPREHWSHAIKPLAIADCCRVILCNQCPYVKHVADELKKIADECLAQGIGVAGISRNDAGPTQTMDRNR